MDDAESVLHLILHLTNADGTTQDFENLNQLRAKLQLTDDDVAAIRNSGAELDEMLSYRLRAKQAQLFPRVQNRLVDFFDVPDGALPQAAPANAGPEQSPPIGPPAETNGR